MSSKQKLSTTSLLDYAQAEELSAIRGLMQQRDTAAEGATTAEQQIADLKRRLSERRVTDVTRAVQRVAGNNALSVDKELSVYELENAIIGLERELPSKKRQMEEAQGKVRSATVDLLRTCVDRAGADYVAHAQQMTAAWRNVAIAELLLHDVANLTIVHAPTWAKLSVPGCTEVPSIAKHSPDKFSLAPMISGADELPRVEKDVHMLRIQMICELGGSPF